MASNPLDKILRPRFPACAVGFEKDAIAAVQLERGRGGFVVRRAASVTLPADLVRPGFDESNVGDPAENANMGAVINEGSMKSILDYIDIGKKDGRLITGGGRATNAGEGYFLQPTVIADIPPKSRLEQEEVFGPVLAVVKAKNYDHALEIANDTEFGLTGAVYTKSREKIERAVREFHVGNLYINRKCTGAIVGAHPFGGFNMSGTDSKSGGPDYLYLFTQAKSVGEKVT